MRWSEMSSGEPIGTLAEEAAKLAAVLQDWAGDHHEQSAAGRVEAATADGVPEHESASPCRHCPICAVIRTAQGTSPQARQHLATAAVSLVMAVQEMLSTAPESAGRAGPGDETGLAED